MNSESNMAKQPRTWPSLMKTGRGGALRHLNKASGTKCDLNFIDGAKLAAKHPFHGSKNDLELKVANVFSTIK